MESVNFYYKIDAINEKGIGEKIIRRSDVQPEYIEGEFLPIPLTPEILEKAGFRLSRYVTNEWFLPDGLCVHKDDGVFTLIISERRQPVLNSFHQLQNLYFALTGEELNIQL